MLCPDQFSAALEVDKSATSVVTNTDDTGLVIWYELCCYYTSHCRFVQLPNCTDPHRLKLERLRLARVGAFALLRKRWEEEPIHSHTSILEA